MSSETYRVVNDDGSIRPLPNCLGVLEGKRATYGQEAKAGWARRADGFYREEFDNKRPKHCGLHDRTGAPGTPI